MRHSCALSRSSSPRKRRIGSRTKGASAVAPRCRCGACFAACRCRPADKTPHPPTTYSHTRPTSRSPYSQFPTATVQACNPWCSRPRCVAACDAAAVGSWRGGNARRGGGRSEARAGSWRTRVYARQGRRRSEAAGAALSSGSACAGGRASACSAARYVISGQNVVVTNLWWLCDTRPCRDGDGR